MKKTLLTAVLVLLVAAVNADAANLVVNGSFENGLTGWTIGGTSSDAYPPVAINYNSATPYPTGAFGEAIPVNNAPTNSEDPVGTHAAYFVADFATDQSLSQSIGPLGAGTYQIGFSSYAPANGFANLYDATFSGVIATVALANYSVKGGTATTWQTFAGSVDLAEGMYTVEFVFNTAGYPAADVVIDQVYVIAGNPPIPTPTGVPDAGTTVGLLAIGLTGLAGVARRVRRR